MPSLVSLDELRDALGGRSYSGNVQCPAHEDRHASLSCKEIDGKILVKCFTGCSQDDVINELVNKGLWDKGGTSYPDYPAQVRSYTAPVGLTVEQYAEYKKIPVDFLKDLGLRTVDRGSKQVRIPYFNKDGEIQSTRYRKTLAKGKPDNRFEWKKGDKQMLYGLDRIDPDQTYIVFVEGESDTQTLWYNGFNTLGLPSAGHWKNEYQDLVEPFHKIIIIAEPDQGGEAVKKNFYNTNFVNNTYVISQDLLNGSEDPSNLWIKDPENFTQIFQSAIDNAVPLTDLMDKALIQERADAWEQCKELAMKPNILEEVVPMVNKLKLVGEDSNAKLLYLVGVSRRLQKPVSPLVEGTSSAGKSFLVETVLKLFRKDTDYYFLSGLSEKALIYFNRDVKHKMIFISEYQAINSDMLSYFLRTLMSEGRIEYWVTVIDPDTKNPDAILVEKSGPTGCILTTTATSIHWENQTRHALDIQIDESPEQTARIMYAIADETDISIYDKDLKQWHNLQRWIDTMDNKVTIPYGAKLSQLMPNTTVRQRRDFTAVLSLIRSNAILHQYNREKDKGSIVATEDDYNTVKDLASKVIATTQGMAVSEEVREVIEAVNDILMSDFDKETVTINELVRYFKESNNLPSLSRSQIARRVSQAKDGETSYLEHAGMSKKLQLKIGNPLPENQNYMPDWESLRTDAPETEIVVSPPPQVSITEPETVKLENNCIDEIYNFDDKQEGDAQVFVEDTTIDISPERQRSIWVAKQKAIHGDLWEDDEPIEVSWG